MANSFVAEFFQFQFMVLTVFDDVWKGYNAFVLNVSITLRQIYLFS